MHKLLSGKWLFRHFLVLLVAVVLVNFGFWQLRRLDEKRARNNAILTTLQAPPVTLTGAALDPADFQLRRVQVTGTFDHAQAMILRNRSFNNTPGVHLLTPLRIDGQSSAVLVDRGWLPLNAAAPEERSLFNGPGPVTVEGIAYQTQTRPGALTPLDKVQAGESRLDAWFRVDIDMIQQQIPYALLPVFVAQTNTLAAAPTDLPRPVGQVQLDEGPHLSYAVQWFSFALALVVIYGFFIRQELSN